MRPTIRMYVIYACVHGLNVYTHVCTCVDTLYVPMDVRRHAYVCGLNVYTHVCTCVDTLYMPMDVRRHALHGPIHA